MCRATGVFHISSGLQYLYNGNVVLSIPVVNVFWPLLT